MSRGNLQAGAVSPLRNHGAAVTYAIGAAGGTGEWVVREPLTGRVASGRSQVVGSGPVGERATPSGYAVRGPCPLGQDPLRNAASDDRVNTA
jgi:hypothetical protein